MNHQKVDYIQNKSVKVDARGNRGKGSRSLPRYRKGQTLRKQNIDGNKVNAVKAGLWNLSCKPLKAYNGLYISGTSKKQWLQIVVSCSKRTVGYHNIKEEVNTKILKRQGVSSRRVEELVRQYIYIQSV